MPPLNVSPTQVEHLNASLQIIGINAAAYYGGALHAYRPVAAELRKLLCDYQRQTDISLLPQFFPDVHLHVLAGSAETMIDEYTTLYIPALMSFDGKGGSDIDVLFDEAGRMLPLNQWLDQRLFRQDVTMKEFIRSVADKEGVHADAHRNAALQLTRGVQFPGGETLAAKTIIAIARYVVRGIGIRILVARKQGQASVDAARLGAIILDLKALCSAGISTIPLKYASAQELQTAVRWTPEAWLVVEQNLATYNPRAEYLLLVLDLNGRHSSTYKIGFSR